MQFDPPLQLRTKEYSNNQHSNNQQTLIKRDSGLFDVTMGAYGEAEVCELVGSYLLYELSKLYEKKDIGLYRDDGLAVFKNKSGPESEKN